VEEKGRVKGDGLRFGKKGRVKFEEKWVGLRVGKKGEY
jgi:hypothetical protein